ncbi:1-acylglycerol-3-phosphate O-acyltransferase [Vairimorpha necatrix]|uniref:1-acylglycerol-3-phosphate O-acyltransferase n=1 Tax=Vairimorpha necatrix TaxID=6039 RepID=A0AAX4JFH0_9MICR
MFEQLFRLSLLFSVGSIFVVGLCYSPFAYVLSKFNSSLHFKIAHKFFGLFLMTLNTLTKRFIEFDGENIINPNENYLIISNHVNYYDFTFISGLFSQSNTLGSLKFVIKSEMRSIPGIFQILNLLNFLVVERNYEKDEKTIRTYCRRSINNKTSLNMIIFPEGTIITENTMNKSTEFRRSKGLNPLKYVLSPKYRGFELMVNEFKNSHIKKILDLTFTYPEGEQPSMWGIFFGGKKYKVRYTMNVIDIETVDDTKEFINQAWNKKEDWISRAVNFNDKWYLNKKEIERQNLLPNFQVIENNK